MLIVVIYLPVSSLTIIILFYIVSVIRLSLKTFLSQEEAFPEKRFLAKILKNMEYSLKEVPEARNTIDFSQLISYIFLPVYQRCQKCFDHVSNSLNWLSVWKIYTWIVAFNGLRENDNIIFCHLLLSSVMYSTSRIFPPPLINRLSKSTQPAWF